MRIIKKHPILTVFLLVCVLFLARIGLTYYASYKEEKARWNTLSENVTALTEDFSGNPSVVIKNLKRSWLIVIDPEARIPSASIVKIPIMAACFYAAKEDKIKLGEKITLKQADKTGGSGILKNKRSGTTLTVTQLIDLMITISDNTASNMLIKLLGFDYLNACFKKFGLTDTNLSRVMMDMRSRSKGIENYTTAKDMVRLLEKIYKGKLINKEISKECLDVLKEQRSRTRIPRRLPKDTIVAHKTGLEKGVCHDVGIVFTDNGDFIICVLISHKNKSARSAKKLIADIAHLSYDYYMSG